MEINFSSKIFVKISVMSYEYKLKKDKIKRKKIINKSNMQIPKILQFYPIKKIILNQKHKPLFGFMIF